MDGWRERAMWVIEIKLLVWACCVAMGLRKRWRRFICIPVGTVPAFISTPCLPDLERVPYPRRVGGDFVFWFTFQLSLQFSIGAGLCLSPSSLNPHIHQYAGRRINLMMYPHVKSYRICKAYKNANMTVLKLEKPCTSNQMLFRLAMFLLFAGTI